jgi:hypothetical protein
MGDLAASLEEKAVTWPILEASSSATLWLRSSQPARGHRVKPTQDIGAALQSVQDSDIIRLQIPCFRLPGERDACLEPDVPKGFPPSTMVLAVELALSAWFRANK